jgi:hypothetical protein
MVVSKFADEIGKLWMLFLHVRKLTPAMSEGTTDQSVLRSPGWYSADRVSLPDNIIGFHDPLTADTVSALSDLPAWLNELYMVKLYELLSSHGWKLEEKKDVPLFNSHPPRCKCVSCLLTMIEDLKNRSAHTGGVYTLDRAAEFHPRKASPTMRLYSENSRPSTPLPKNQPGA